MSTTPDIHSFGHKASLAARRLVWRVTEPFTWHDRGLATASWWDEYEILPGDYPLEWVNLSYRPWNPDPSVPTSGYVANVGPYYAGAKADVVQTVSYRESRILSEVRPTTERPNSKGTRSFHCYAYDVQRRLDEGLGFAGGGEIVDLGQLPAAP